VAKLALIQRELKREKLVAKYATKYAELKAISNDAKKSDEERAAARMGLQKLRDHGSPAWHLPSVWFGSRQDPRVGIPG
jgi:small subunit ribosomal protein S14